MFTLSSLTIFTLHAVTALIQPVGNATTDGISGKPLTSRVVNGKDLTLGTILSNSDLSPIGFPITSEVVTQRANRNVVAELALAEDSIQTAKSTIFDSNLSVRYGLHRFNASYRESRRDSATSTSFTFYIDIWSETDISRLRNSEDMQKSIKRQLREKLKNPTDNSLLLVVGKRRAIKTTLKFTINANERFWSRGKDVSVNYTVKKFGSLNALFNHLSEESAQSTSLTCSLVGRTVPSIVEKIKAFNSSAEKNVSLANTRVRSNLLLDLMISAAAEVETLAKNPDESTEVIGYEVIPIGEITSSSAAPTYGDIASSLEELFDLVADATRIYRASGVPSESRGGLGQGINQAREILSEIAILIERAEASSGNKRPAILKMVRDKIALIRHLASSPPSASPHLNFPGDISVIPFELGMKQGRSVCASVKIPSGLEWTHFTVHYEAYFASGLHEGSFIMEKEQAGTSIANEPRTDTNGIPNTWHKFDKWNTKSASLGDVVYVRPDQSEYVFSKVVPTDVFKNELITSGSKVRFLIHVYNGSSVVSMAPIAEGSTQ